jgi:DNA-directed RNA polymerase subunit M/transcription elongation factor TFIIS
MENLNQKLTQAIHELIPEAVLDKSWSRHTCGLLMGCEGCNMERIEKWDEPLLRHVLWALEVVGFENHFAISTDGAFMQWNPEFFSRDYNESNITYDLTKTLYEQTEETKQWLLDLLTPKECKHTETVEVYDLNTSLADTEMMQVTQCVDCAHILHRRPKSNPIQ